MKSSSVWPCFLLGCFLFAWTSISQNASDRMRCFAIAAMTPAWNCGRGVQEYLSDRPLSGFKKMDLAESSMLKIENRRLRDQLEYIKRWMLHEAGLRQESKKSYLDALFDLESQAIAAQVIYRDPSSWSSSLWIGIGEEDNRQLGYLAVARNSPVVEGGCLVGVVEYVGKRQSRVRLITDSGLCPAVRVLRNAEPVETLSLIDALIVKLVEHPDLFQAALDLGVLKEKIKKETSEIYLAKGELHGNSAPFWRSRHPILQGIGFNFDYSDSLGAARELRTGSLLSTHDKPLAIIEVGDHLVTSGLDGVFPRGLSVAIATSVHPLTEGAFSYEIEARPTAPSLTDLRTVFVLPPLHGE